MRTTLSLDDDVFKQAAQYADARSLRLGKAISELVRKGLHAQLETKEQNGIHIVVLPAGSPKITTEHVRRLELED